MADDTSFYPPALPAGFNALGLFSIGISALGDIPAFDWRKTIASQYANSPRLLQVIASIAASFDQTENLGNFFDLVWNVDTAVKAGLDVWGRIVDISRSLQIASDEWFGFDEAGDAFGFEQAPFWPGAAFTTTYRLDDEPYRRLIIAKAMANISDGSVPSINAILMYLFFGRGNAYVQDGQVFSFFGFSESLNAVGFDQSPFYNGQSVPWMSISYVFDFPLTPIDYAIINSGVLPRPAGVATSITVNA